LYGAEDSTEIWEVFAKRGLGYSAKQGLSSSRSDGTEAFDLPKTVSSGLGQLNLAELKVWPNPSNNSFNIQLANNEKGNLVVWDASGKVWINQNIQGFHQLEMPNQATSGIYFIKVTTQQGVFQNKLVLIK